MFNSISMTGVGAFITLVESALRFANIEFPEGSVAAAVNGVLAALGLIWLVWGQIRRTDLVGGLVRK